MKPLRLTARSSSVKVLTMEFIRRYALEHGRTPKLRDIARGLAGPDERRIRVALRKLDVEGAITVRFGPGGFLLLPDEAAHLSDEQVAALGRARGLHRTCEGAQCRP